MSLITSSPAAALAQAQPQVHFDLSHILVVIESSFPSEGDAYGFEGYCRVCHPLCHRDVSVIVADVNRQMGQWSG